MANRFDSGTGVTVGKVPCDSFAHSWPPVISGDEFVSGSSSRVSSRRVVMVGMDDIAV